MIFKPSQLRTFLTVLEHDSLRAAADELRISPAAVSSSLASLSQAVGVALFERSGRGVKLTASGVCFADDARRIFALSEGSIASARAAAAAQDRPLRIGAVGAASEIFLGQLLANFMRGEPRISVELEVVRREAMWRLLGKRELDLGFVEVPPHRPELRLLAMRPNDYVVCAPAGKRYDRRTLANSTWLLREPGAGTRTEAEEFMREYGIEPEIRSLGANAAIVHCVLSGVGVSLLAKDRIADEVRARTIQVVRTPFTPRSRPWFLVTSSDRNISSTMSLFVTAARGVAFVDIE